MKTLGLQPGNGKGVVRLVVEKRLNRQKMRSDEDTIQRSKRLRDCRTDGLGG